MCRTSAAPWRTKQRAKEIVMPRQIVTAALIAVALLGAPAFAKSKPHKSGNGSGSVTYNVDSKDRNVGWHTINGMRVCTQDCENPEIPGSGYTCRNLPGGWRECVSN
jgi:hypothetical protein